MSQHFLLLTIHYKEYDSISGFVDLEKAFDRVPREVISWAMRKLGVEEWLVSAWNLPVSSHSQGIHYLTTA